MKKYKNTLAASMLLAILFFSACSDDGGINVFPLSKDKELGEQLKAQIAADPATYPVVSASTYATAYTHINRIKDAILNTGLLNHKDDFAWEVYLIKNDTVLNAFACPGGYIYIYTGIIKYLDNEAQLAGVLAHEMAHVDRRHSTDQLTKAYGIQGLISIILGNEASDMEIMLGQIAGGLTALKFSRTAEYEADNYAVQYMYKTEYHAPALGDFFVKMGLHSGTPAFLSTHPDPGNRVQKINDEWESLGGKTGGTFVDRYGQFKASLP
jgi:predicted Zn-dependent protease